MRIGIIMVSSGEFTEELAAELAGMNYAFVNDICDNCIDSSLCNGKGNSYKKPASRACMVKAKEILENKDEYFSGNNILRL